MNGVLLGFFFFNYSLHSLLVCLHFRCATQWLHNYTLQSAFLLIFSVPHGTIYIITIILLTIFPVLYFIPRVYFVTTNSDFLIPSPLSQSPQNTNPSGNHQFALCVCFNFLCLFSLFFNSHIYMKSNGICLSLTNLLNGEFFYWHDLRREVCIWPLQSRDHSNAAKYPTEHVPPHNTGVSSPKCQQHFFQIF